MKFTIDKLSSYTISSYKATFEGAATVVKTSGASFSGDEMTLTLTNAELASLGEDNVDVKISFVMSPTQYLCTEKFKMAVEDTDSGYVLYFSKYNDKEYVSLQTNELAGLSLDNDFSALFSYTDSAIATHNASSTAHSDLRNRLGELEGILCDYAEIPNLNPFPAGWYRVCSIAGEGGYYSYISGLIIVTGEWNNGSPTTGSYFVAYRHSSVLVQKIASIPGQVFTKIRITGATGGNKMYVDVYTPGISGAINRQKLTFLGNVRVIDKYNPTAPGAEAMTLVSECDV